MMLTTQSLETDWQTQAEEIQEYIMRLQLQEVCSSTLSDLRGKFVSRQGGDFCSLSTKGKKIPFVAGGGWFKFHALQFLTGS